MTDTMRLFDINEVGPQIGGESTGVFPGGFAGSEYGCMVGGGCGNLKQQQMVAQLDAADLGAGSQVGGYRRKTHRNRRKTRRNRRKQHGGARRRATTQKRTDPFFLKLRVTGGISLKQRGRRS